MHILQGIHLLRQLEAVQWFTGLSSCQTSILRLYKQRYQAAAAISQEALASLWNHKSLTTAFSVFANMEEWTSRSCLLACPPASDKHHSLDAWHVPRSVLSVLLAIFYLISSRGSLVILFLQSQRCGGTGSRSTASQCLFLPSTQ